MAQAKRAKTTKKATKKTAVVKQNHFSKNWFDISGWNKRLQQDLELQQSSFSLILGGIIVVVLAVLLFNYFNKPTGSLVPAQQTTNTQQADVAKDSLPGKYTVKDGDTLYSIAQKYYNNGFLYSKIVEANQITDANSITAGQVLEIPKVEESANSTPSPTPSSSPTLNANTNYVQGGTGGAVNQTEWGESITGNTYTVQSGDWLSKIAGRAYGDILAYQRIAQANNIKDPNLIEPGQVLVIPR